MNKDIQKTTTGVANVGNITYTHWCLLETQHILTV